MNVEKENEDNKDNNIQDLSDKYNWIKDLIDKGSESIKHFISSKYSHDKTGLFIYLIIVFILACAITLLAIFKNLDTAIVGTLFGSLIGFAFGNFPKGNRSDHSNN